MLKGTSIESKADAARVAVEQHAEATGNANDDYAAQIGDLLANLMHFAQTENLSFDELLATARMHFEHEGGDGLACFDTGDDVTVRTSSEEFGAETFTYQTIGEAVAGMRRLASAAVEANDGVEREIVMLCPFPVTAADA